MAAVLLSTAGAGAAMVASSSAANAGPLCTAAYSVPTQWNTGFTATLTVTSGATAITGWTVTLTYPATGNQVLQAGWNGGWSQSGKTVTVSNLPYNGNLAAATTLTGIGAVFSGTSSPPIITCTAQ
jgi:cellulase/cellobiase CelA1